LSGATQKHHENLANLSIYSGGDLRQSPPNQRRSSAKHQISAFSMYIQSAGFSNTMFNEQYKISNIAAAS
jgi:hypothetical protein